MAINTENKTTDRLATALDTLQQGIKQLAESGEWQRYLAVQARFHRYSFSNVVLILSQRPDATRAASMKAWNDLGRRVNKGEKALWILAPSFRPKADEAKTAQDEDTKDETTERKPVAFRPVPVFDFGQTSGDPLPEPVKALTGDQDGGLFDALKSFAEGLGLSVTVEPIPGSVNGYFVPDTGAVVVDSGLSPVHRCKTLAHELGHADLHRDPEVYRAHRGDCELEAESVAYCVLSHFGLDAGSYSFGYVTGWAGGGEDAIKALKTCATRIQGAAKAIIEGIEAQMAKLEDEAAA